MTVNINRENTKMYAQLKGRLDTSTSTEAEAKLKDGIDSVTELVLDLKELDYISSAGLRLLLSLQKIMNKQGSMKITNVNDIVNEIFEVTGFSDILTIE